MYGMIPGQTWLESGSDHDGSNDVSRVASGSMEGFSSVG